MIKNLFSYIQSFLVREEVKILLNKIKTGELKLGASVHNRALASDFIAYKGHVAYKVHEYLNDIVTIYPATLFKNHFEKKYVYHDKVKIKLNRIESNCFLNLVHLERCKYSEQLEKERLKKEEEEKQNEITALKKLIFSD